MPTVEPVRFGHKPRTESQFDVIDPFAFCVLHVFKRNPPACGDIAQHDGLYHQDWHIEDYPAAVTAFRQAASTMTLAHP